MKKVRWLIWLAFWLPLQAVAMAPEARDWLMKMTQARVQTNFEGVFVYSRGRDMTSMRILHRYADGVEQERLIVLDGDRREIVRNGDRVICIFPGNRQVPLRQALPGGPFGGAVLGVEPMERFYDVRVLGRERVAGVSAVHLQLRARDADRYSYDLWLEASTGLLVKSWIVDADGEPLERFHFTELILNPELDAAAFEVPEGEGVVRHDTLPARDGTDTGIPRVSPGWLPAGFVRAPNEVSVQPDPMDSIAQTYTDGLASLTVFVEPADEGMPAGGMRVGASVAYTTVRQVEGRAVRVTVVGEVPLATARKVAESVGENA